MVTVFTPKIKDKKCKHKWTKLSAKAQGGLFGGGRIEFEYLFCPKCNSTAGEEIRR